MDSDQIKALSARFPVGEVKQREASGGRMLDFISIDSVIDRLLAVCPDYETIDGAHEMVGPFDVQRKRKVDGEWKTVVVPHWLAHVRLTLVVGGCRHVGVGADYADDPDKALKTALAEAIKKAANQVGVALYLWKEEERAKVAHLRGLAKDPKKLRNFIARKAVENGCELGTDREANAVKLADFYLLDSPSELDDIETLRRIAGVGAEA